MCPRYHLLSICDVSFLFQPPFGMGPYVLFSAEFFMKTSQKSIAQKTLAVILKSCFSCAQECYLSFKYRKDDMHDCRAGPLDEGLGGA